MSLANTIQLSYSSSDFKDGNAKFAPTNTYKGLTFANISSDLLLGATTWGLVKLEVTYTASSSMDSASVFICHPNGAWSSISESASSPFLKVNANGYYSDIKLVAGQTKTIYMIANIDDNVPTEPTYTVNVALGKKSGTASGNVTISYDCVSQPFSYNVGMHVYSPFDAFNSSKLTTTIYSFTPIESWTVNTLVFATKGFDYLAFPYYYSYADKVYKIGGKLDRSYGTLTFYESRKRLFGKTKIYEYTEGPKGWYDSVNDLTASCVVPTLSDTGRIKQIITGSTLAQPTLYRYYVGYDSTDKVKSNDSVFGKWSFANKRYYPITGARHALEKITQGYISGWSKTWDPALWPLIAGGTGLALAGIANGVILSTWATGVATGNSLLGPFMSWLLNAGGAAIFTPVVGWIIAGVIALIAIWSLFKTRKETFKEPCLKFRHVYVESPYIELSEQIWEDSDKTTKLNGYYCDGVYFYTQNNNVTEKEISYTNAISSEDPISFQYETSILVDSPTHVTDSQKLIVLPYTSGSPVNPCGNGTIYTSSQMSSTITPSGAGELMTCESVTVSLPAGFEWSCISQEDANTRANSHFQQIVQQALEKVNQIGCREIENIAILDAHFTHELAIENTPTEVSCYYDNSDGNGLTVGKKLYYDSQGYYRVLNGYYSTVSPSKKFYKTVNGEVIEIWNQSSATTVINGSTTLNLYTTDLNFSSDWLWFSNDKELLLSDTQGAYNSRNNPNSYIDSSKIFRAKIQRPYNECGSSIRKWNGSIYTSTGVESGWYRPMNDWIIEDPIYFAEARTVYINLVSICPTSSTLNTPYGVELRFVNSSGQPVRADNDFEITLKTFNGESLLEQKTVSISKDDVVKYVPHVSISVNESITSYQIEIENSTICSTTYQTGTQDMCNVERFTGIFELQKAGTTTKIYARVISGVPFPTVGQYVKVSGAAFTGCWLVTSTSISGVVADNWITQAAFATLAECQASTPPCQATLAVTTTNPTNQAGNNGTARATITGFTGTTITYQLLNSSGTVITSNYTGYFENLSANTVYSIEVADNTGCNVRQTFTIGENTFQYLADYMLLTWNFTDGRDLDIRTRMVEPNVGQQTIRSMIGWGLSTKWADSSDNDKVFMRWAGDNQGTGKEMVLVDLIKFRALYPNENVIKIDYRGFWYSQVGVNPVSIEAQLYQGGTVSGPTANRTFVISNPTSTYTLSSPGKTISLKTQNQFQAGERIAVLTYNLVTGVGSLDSNDTTTPVPTS